MSAIDEMYKKYGATFKIPSPMMFRLNGCTLETYYESMFTEGYKPFTAEKQLELIKLISQLEGYSLSIYKDEDKYVFELFDDSCTYSVVNSECDDYTDSLAFLVSQLTEYLDNQKVKEILER